MYIPAWYKVECHNGCIDRYLKFDKQYLSEIRYFYMIPHKHNALKSKYLLYGITDYYTLDDIEIIVEILKQS